MWSSKSYAEEIKRRDEPNKIMYEGKGNCVKAMARKMAVGMRAVTGGAMTRGDQVAKGLSTSSNKGHSGNSPGPSLPGKGQIMRARANRPDPSRQAWVKLCAGKIGPAHRHRAGAKPCA